MPASLSISPFLRHQPQNWQSRKWSLQPECSCTWSSVSCSRVSPKGFHGLIGSLACSSWLVINSKRHSSCPRIVIPSLILGFPVINDCSIPVQADALSSSAVSQIRIFCNIDLAVPTSIAPSHRLAKFGSCFARTFASIMKNFFFNQWIYYCTCRVDPGADEIAFDFCIEERAA